jgi:ammonium transporter Rh
MSACWLARLAKGKLDMEIVLNSTLAGGVAIGASADLINYPFGSMLVGFVVGIISALGYIYLQPWLKIKINLHDTCGVHNLHGMPGIIGGFVSAIAAGFSGRNFGTGSAAYDHQFPEGGDGRSPRTQAAYQLATLGVTLGIAVFSGVIAGYITTSSFFQPPTTFFHDDEHWHEVEVETEPKFG